PAVKRSPWSAQKKCVICAVLRSSLASELPNAESKVLMRLIWSKVGPRQNANNGNRAAAPIRVVNAVIQAVVTPAARIKAALMPAVKASLLAARVSLGVPKRYHSDAIQRRCYLSKYPANPRFD